MNFKDEEHYWKGARVCWWLAGIFAAIAIIGHTLVLVMTLLGIE